MEKCEGMKKGYYVLMAIGLLILIFLVYAYVPTGSKKCVSDEDCVPFGSGSSSYGCYNKERLPLWRGPACFCAAPRACECSDGVCVGDFE